MYPINERFLQVIDYLGVSAYKLAKELGTSDAVLSNIKSGKNKPSTEIIEKLLNNYKIINPTWLIVGDGKMILNKGENDPEHIDILEESKSNYSNCLLCKEKDRRIEDLKRQIAIQSDYIEHLKEQSPTTNSNGQKRKAS